MSLPPLNPVLLQQTTPDLFYPIGILSSLPLGKQIDLDAMLLTCPIHIHIPGVHIGRIQSLPPGQSITAFDLFRYLQALAGTPLYALTNYSQLSHRMRIEVGAAFMHRNGRSLSTNKAWNAFRSGQPMRWGPAGVDLLLGNINIWGIEERSACGYSVIHLA